MTKDGLESCTTVKKEHFEEALTNVKPSLSTEQILWHVKFSLLYIIILYKHRFAKTSVSDDTLFKVFQFSKYLVHDQNNINLII